MSRFLRYAALGALVTAPLGVYALAVRPWRRRWGVDATESAATLPGDDIVAEATAVETRGITIDAAPDDVWPWLVQMGYGRAGWYSYDQLDMKGRSATEIVPEWQGLKAGDTVPTHPDGGFVVRVLEPQRALVLYVDSAMAAGWKRPRVARIATSEVPGLHASGVMLDATMPHEFAGTWAFAIKPQEDGRTRLIERARFHFGDQAAGVRIAKEALGFGVFLMMRRQLLGIRDHAEALARTKVPAPYTAPYAAPSGAPMAT